jgi:hypothetical protein
VAGCAEAVLEAELAYFYELRLNLRGRPEAIALVDRCISMICRAQDASGAEFEALAAEVEALRSELIARFGATPPH